MSRTGATKPTATRLSSITAPRRHTGADGVEFFVPNLCATRSVFFVVLVAELVAVTLCLARPGTQFFYDLSRFSLFTQWLALTSAAVLCYARPRLARLSVPVAVGAIYALLIVNAALFSEIALRIGAGALSGGIEDALASAVPARERWSFLLRNEGICVIVTTLLLRYAFVAHQWRAQVRAEARARLDALQARIRPHFLFNTMNTIAALTRSDPVRAEAAVEDLAELLRATLRESDGRLKLAQELELTRVYQRIEELRLGSRLTVHWDTAELPPDALVPGLTIQPLLENAIYHGVELLPEGGAVTIAGRLINGTIELSVVNPVPSPSDGMQRAGNRLALDNIRARLELAYGEAARMRVEPGAAEFRVTLAFPVQT